MRQVSSTRMTMTNKLTFGRLVYVLGAVGCTVAILSALFAAAPAFALNELTATVGPGASGGNVTSLQMFLATDATVYPEGIVSGFYGPLTVAAVQRFQCKRGIVCSGSAETNGYGRVGPRTLAEVHASIAAGVGGASKDEFAPTISAGTIATTSNSVMLNWTTNEPARSRVMYGTSYPYLYAIAPSFVDATFDTNANVVLTGLAPRANYYFVRESVDANGNLMWDIPRLFLSP